MNRRSNLIRLCAVITAALLGNVACDRCDNAILLDPTYRHCLPWRPHDARDADALSALMFLAALSCSDHRCLVEPKVTDEDVHAARAGTLDVHRAAVDACAAAMRDPHGPAA